jgi:hypothetical protein
MHTILRLPLLLDFSRDDFSFCTEHGRSAGFVRGPFSLRRRSFEYCHAEFDTLVTAALLVKSWKFNFGCRSA